VAAPIVHDMPWTKGAATECRPYKITSEDQFF
jgi:hypothetical protein